MNIRIAAMWISFRSLILADVYLYVTTVPVLKTCYLLFQFEFKSKSIAKKRVDVTVSVDGVKVLLQRPKPRLPRPFNNKHLSSLLQVHIRGGGCAVV